MTHVLPRVARRITLRLSPAQVALLRRYGGEVEDVEEVGRDGRLLVTAQRGTWRVLLHELDARLDAPTLEPSWNSRDWSRARRVVERLWRIFNLQRAIP